MKILIMLGIGENMYTSRYWVKIPHDKKPPWTKSLVTEAPMTKSPATESPYDKIPRDYWDLRPQY